MMMGHSSNKWYSTLLLGLFSCTAYAVLIRGPSLLGFEVLEELGGGLMMEPWFFKGIDRYCNAISDIFFLENIEARSDDYYRVSARCPFF